MCIKSVPKWEYLCALFNRQCVAQGGQCFDLLLDFVLKRIKSNYAPTFSVDEMHNTPSKKKTDYLWPIVHLEMISMIKLHNSIGYDWPLHQWKSTFYEWSSLDYYFRITLPTILIFPLASLYSITCASSIVSNM